MENEKQDKAIYDITRDVARQQREIETLKYKVAILERDKHEGSVEVREMTVEEVARIICSQKGYDPDALYMPHHLIKKMYEWQRFAVCAKALAKLGTIRIVGDV